MVALPGERDEPGHGCAAHAAARRLHRPPERLRVGRIDQQRQVGERITDLGALVQPETAQHPMRDSGLRQRGLHRLGRVAGAREDEDLPRRDAGRQRLADRACDPVRLVVLGLKGADLHAPASPPHRDQRLRRPPLVLRHARHRRVEDLRPGAEVAAEHDPPVAREALAELEHVARLRAPPGVDELVVVRHRAHVSVRSDQERDQDALGLVRVLELIDHDPFPALAVVRQTVRVLGQQSHRLRPADRRS